MTIKALAIGNSVCLAIHIVFSYLSQTGVFNGVTIGDVSDKYETLFTPAGITFSIWGLIYLSLAGFCIYHSIKAFTRTEEHGANRDLRKAGYLLMIVNLSAALWVLAWTYDYIFASLLLMITQLILLFTLSQKLNIHNARRSIKSKLFTQIPVSLFYGWITLAFFANTASFLVSLNWNGWGISEINWTITLIAFIMLITLGILNRRRNVVFGMVIIWGLYGIILKRTDLGAMEFQPIIWVAWGCIGIIAIGIFFALLRNLRIRRDPNSEEIRINKPG